MSKLVVTIPEPANGFVSKLHTHILQQLLRQGYTNLGPQVARAAKFCYVGPNIVESSV